MDQALTENPILSNSLGSTILHVYLKVEGFCAHQNSLFPVYTAHSLQDILNRQTIIEYPSFYIYTQPPCLR